MRILIVLVLVPALLVQGCATAAMAPRDAAAANPSAEGARTSPPRVPSREDLDDINFDLTDVTATVELAGGEVVREAVSVKLGPETTTWHDRAGRERSVPTADVSRVLMEQRHMAGKGFGYGAALGGAIAFPVLLHEGSSSPNAGVTAVGLVIGGGLLGLAVALSARHEVVIYSAPSAGPPAERRAEAGVQRCRLAPAASHEALVCAAP